MRMKTARNRLRQAISVTLDATHIEWCEACIREKRFSSYSAAIDYCIRREVERQKADKNEMSVEDRLLRLEQAILFPRRDSPLYPVSRRKRKPGGTAEVVERAAEASAEGAQAGDL